MWQISAFAETVNTKMMKLNKVIKKIYSKKSDV